MKKSFTFKNTQHSQLLEDYANKQLVRIEDFLKNERSPMFIDMVFEPSKVRVHHNVVLRVKTPSCELISQYEGPEFYDVVDRVIDTMYQSLLQEKDKRLSDRKMVGRKEEFKKQR